MSGRITDPHPHLHPLRGPRQSTTPVGGAPLVGARRARPRPPLPGGVGDRPARGPGRAAGEGDRCSDAQGRGRSAGGSRAPDSTRSGAGADRPGIPTRRPRDCRGSPDGVVTTPCGDSVGIRGHRTALGLGPFSED
eukprot:8244532-Pyramimonas_sp.AAC.1